LPSSLSSSFSSVISSSSSWWHIVKEDSSINRRRYPWAPKYEERRTWLVALLATIDTSSRCWRFLERSLQRQLGLPCSHARHSTLSFHTRYLQSRCSMSLDWGLHTAISLSCQNSSCNSGTFPFHHNACMLWISGILHNGDRKFFLWRTRQSRHAFDMMTQHSTEDELRLAEASRLPMFRYNW
jgi:hypothetical protein